nr:hypothetical protein [Deltaproteobacteria bacterium]
RIATKRVVSRRPTTPRPAFFMCCLLKTEQCEVLGLIKTDIEVLLKRKARKLIRSRAVPSPIR